HALRPPNSGSLAKAPAMRSSFPRMFAAMSSYCFPPVLLPGDFSRPHEQIFVSANSKGVRKNIIGNLTSEGAPRDCARGKENTELGTSEPKTHRATQMIIKIKELREK